MDKLCINKTQDYLALLSFRKEIYSSDLRQALQKHQDSQIRKKKSLSPSITQVMVNVENTALWNLP